MSKRILCSQVPKKGRPVTLAETEAHHATRVLRLREGDIVEAMDGQGSRCMAILRVRGGPTRLEFAESENELSSSKSFDSQKDSVSLTLEMSILKGDAMEWVIEKAVELGVKELIPVLTAHTVVQIKNKGPEAFRDRWQKIADQALKQCGRLHRMEVSLPVSLEELLPRSSQTPPWVRFWCDEAGTSGTPYLLDSLKAHPNLSQTRLLIGPEGGWSHLERELLLKEASISPPEKQVCRVQLGPLILRAETAALYSVSLISSFLRMSGP